jgi:hypothetical protein
VTARFLRRNLLHADLKIIPTFWDSPSVYTETAVTAIRGVGTIIIVVVVVASASSSCFFFFFLFFFYRR